MRQRGFLVGLIAVSAAAVAAFALYDSLYLGPAYSRLVVTRAREDAARVAVHLSREFFGEEGLLVPREASAAFRAAVADHLAGYGIERLRAFAPDGTVVFSTSPDEEGRRNAKPYFREIVAGRKVHAGFVRRGDRSQEGRPVTADVVETYVPVLREGRFAGAFEIYYDVTAPMAEGAALLARSNLIVLPLAALLAAAVALAARRAVLALRERDRLAGLVGERSTALEEANRRLHDLSGHLQDAREEERTRVAREIHDELGQSLTAMRMELSLLRRALPAGQRPAAERAASLDALLEETTRAVKRIAQDLRPGILDHLGLQAAVEWQAEEFERRTGIPCSAAVEQVEGALDGQRSTALFRILQESLTNVARHAGAQAVDVRLAPEGGEVVLRVRDDGRGLAGVRGPGSFGIIGMQERVRPWGGAVELDGAAGRGTTVTVRLPAVGGGAS